MKHQQLAPSDDPLVHWRARHDNVIMLHLSGYSNQLIAEMTQFSIGHVQRIIKDPRAQKAIETARRKLLGKAIYTIRERMVNLGVRAVENIAGTIEGEFEAGTKAHRHQDGVSFELLSRIGFGRTDAGEEGGTGIQLPPEEAKRLVDAIEKANRAREIHAVAVEVEAEVVDDESNGRGLGPTNGRESSESEKI